MGSSYFDVIRRRDENVAKSGTLFRSGNLSQTVNGIVHRHRSITYPGRYIILRRVAKSLGGSEDMIRGHPFGDSADARQAWANIRRSAEEWKDRMLG